MLNAKVLSNFFKAKLKFFEKNPNALISTGWRWGDCTYVYINVNGEKFFIDDEKPPLVAWTELTHSNDKDEDGRNFFLQRLKHFTAEHFARRGYSRWDVLWAMFNLLDNDGNVIDDMDWMDWSISPEHKRQSPAALKCRA